MVYLYSKNYLFNLEPNLIRLGAPNRHLIKYLTTVGLKITRNDSFWTKTSQICDQIPVQCPLDQSKLDLGPRVVSYVYDFAKLSSSRESSPNLAKLPDMTKFQKMMVLHRTGELVMATYHFGTLVAYSLIRKNKNVALVLVPISCETKLLMVI